MASEEHQIMVKAMIDYFVEKGFEILTADYEGYDECPQIGRHAPDVVAYDKTTGIQHVCEVETCSSLTENDTKEQFEDFSTYVMKGGTAFEFYPIVPVECYDDLIQLLIELSVYPKNNVNPLKYGKE